MLGCALVLVLVGCGDDGGGGGTADAKQGDGGGSGSDSGGGGTRVDGAIVLVGGGSAPSMGKTFVIWSSDIGQGDFAYKYGEGTATATTFTANVTPPVPSDATFGGRLGVGFVILTASGTTIADGPVDDTVLDAAVLGITGEYAIIFRPNTTPISEVPWIDNFPAGLSCGKCVPQTTGFDSYAPVACTEVKLQVGPQQSIMGCNWT